MADYKKREAFHRHLGFNIAGELLDAAIEFIRDNYAPADIFPEHQLADWAEENGYKEED